MNIFRASSACFDFPMGVLRRAALEIEAVRYGLKPGGLLTLREHFVSSLSSLLSELAWVVKPRPWTRNSFAHVSIPERNRFAAEKLVRVYYARSYDDAVALSAAHEGGNFVETGSRLGYPACCVEFAGTATFSPEGSVPHQPNLVDAALRRSVVADLRCNRVVDESELAQLGPATLIAHYPCHMACSSSLVIADDMSRLCARLWSDWFEVLEIWLHATVYHWSDERWDSTFWDEGCGLALSSELGECTVLGVGMTPDGTIPDDTVHVELLPDVTRFRRRCGNYVDFAYSVSGRPFVCDFKARQIIQPQ